MRIAMLCREMPPVGGGAGAVALQLSRQMVAAGHRVDYVTMQFGEQPTHELVDGVQVVRVPCGRRSATTARVLEMARYLRLARNYIISQHQIEPYDVIHAHSILPEGAVGATRCLTARKIVTAHGSDVPGYNPDRYEFTHRLAKGLWVKTLRRVDIVTAPSAFLAELITSAMPSSNPQVIPNGISQSIEFSERSNRAGVLIASRLVPRKGVDVALEALRGLPATTVDIIGDGPELGRLQALAATLSGHLIRFHGWLDHNGAEWRERYESAQFFLQMSSQENFPVNLLEAQLAGLVVIASDIPGHREVLGADAIYVKESSDALRERLRQEMNKSPANHRANGDRARKRVLGDFLWPTLCDQYLALYE